MACVVSQCRLIYCAPAFWVNALRRGFVDGAILANGSRHEFCRTCRSLGPIRGTTSSPRAVRRTSPGSSVAPGEKNSIWRALLFILELQLATSCASIVLSGVMIADRVAEGNPQPHYACLPHPPAMALLTLSRFNCPFLPQPFCPFGTLGRKSSYIWNALLSNSSPLPFHCSSASWNVFLAF